MQVKGTGIKTTKEFVKTKFSNKYNQWLNALPTHSKKLYEDTLNVGQWFDADTAYYKPIDTIVKELYGNNAAKAGDELGRFSAELALKGIYKVFLLVATPQYLMKRAAQMMQAFYNPSEIEVSQTQKNQVTFIIKKFDNINVATEYRIAGWCTRALELCSCNNVNYKMAKQLSKGMNQTEIVFNWN